MYVCMYIQRAISELLFKKAMCNVRLTRELYFHTQRYTSDINTGSAECFKRRDDTDVTTGRYRLVATDLPRGVFGGQLSTSTYCTAMPHHANMADGLLVHGSTQRLLIFPQHCARAHRSKPSPHRGVTKIYFRRLPQKKKKTFKQILFSMQGFHRNHQCRITSHCRQPVPNKS